MNVVVDRVGALVVAALLMQSESVKRETVPVGLEVSAKMNGDLMKIRDGH